MSKAWLCIPSARPVAEVEPVIAKWKAMGYGVALWRDWRADGDPSADLIRVDATYPGYAETVNYLAEIVLAEYPECDWIVAGGDDTYPDDDMHPDAIAQECRWHFGVSTFGVMQPTGDPWADGQGRIIERIAGSPWLGREWCRRAHAGKGPLFPEFRHMFVDEALQLYAQSLGVFLQRPDLTHFHAHAQRDLENPARLGGDHRKQPAPHMTEWNSQKHWHESKAIFERLKSTNFAECQPIP